MEKVDDLEKNQLPRGQKKWEDKMSMKLFKVHPIILSQSMNLNQP